MGWHKAICPACGSDKVTGYEESETEFILECVLCGESDIKKRERDSMLLILFEDWFF